MTHHQHASSQQDGTSAQALAQGLGWFSIALGLAEVFAPRTLTRTLGMEGHETLVQAYGVREIATGLGILTQADPAPWIWGRIGGDALDLATLAPALSEDNPQRHNAIATMAAVAGVTVLDVICAQMLHAEDRPALPMRDYSRRSGLPRPPEQMRGAASDFEVPRDFRAPEALRPYPISG